MLKYQLNAQSRLMSFQALLGASKDTCLHANKIGLRPRDPHGESRWNWRRGPASRPATFARQPIFSRLGTVSV